MKSSFQASRSVHNSSSSNNNNKSKKNKEREKRKSSGGSFENDKSSSSRDSKQYAGISSDSIFMYAEQFTYEHLSKEVCNTLTEDINYKLRYIIHDALLKARLSGHDIILAGDINETFRNLSIEKVYGPPVSPTWVPFGDQNLLYLDDTKINLIELAEGENTYSQYRSIELTKRWYPDADNPESNSALQNYFRTFCHAVVGNDEELRKRALQDISKNPQIGPIVEWFYHFAYFLLMKNITYDSLTLHALDLIETLEGSPLGSANVSLKQLKLLVRLLLQRLLISVASKDILKPMCSVLAVLCLRDSLKDLVIMKIGQKLMTIKYDVALPILTIVYYLGYDAVKAIFLPNINYFLHLSMKDSPDVEDVILGIYGLICKAHPNDGYVENLFYNVFGDHLVVFWKPLCFTTLKSEKPEFNFITMKTRLMKTRRKVDVTISKKIQAPDLEEVFEMPQNECKVKKKIEEHRASLTVNKKATHVIVGKTSLLLSVFEGMSTVRVGCLNHSLVNYSL